MEYKKCKHGHERTPENVYRNGSCKPCKLARSKKFGNHSKCEHRNKRTNCRQCKILGIGGNSICEHDRQRQSCRECGHRDHCKHKRQRCLCSLCQPGGTYKLYRRNEQKRFELTVDFMTFEEYSEAIKKNCWFCGITPLDANGMGIDRIDNDKGHVSGNIQPCCFVCNGMRSKLTVESFLTKVFRIAAYRKV